MTRSAACSSLQVPWSSRPSSCSGSTVATLWRIAVPTSQANPQTPTTPKIASAPSVRSRTGTMIRNPLPKIEASGVTVASITWRENIGLSCLIAAPYWWGRARPRSRRAGSARAQGPSRKGGYLSVTSRNA